MDPLTLISIGSALYGVWQQVRARKYKAATHELVAAVETASANGMNPKVAVAARTVGTLAGRVIDDVLDAKALRRKVRRERQQATERERNLQA